MKLLFFIARLTGRLDNNRDLVKLERLLQRAVIAAKKAAKKNPATTQSSEVRRSIEALPDGRKYVQATRQVIVGDDSLLWENQIIDYVNDVVRDGEDLQIPTTDGDTHVIDGRTAWKLGYRNQDANGTPISDDAYRTKGTAAGHIDELAEVSQYKKSKPNYKLNQNCGFATSGFDYRVAYFRDFDGEYYRMVLSVGVDGTTKAVYNIGDIRKVPFPVTGSKAKTGTTPSNSKIAQNAPTVNTYSMQNSGNNSQTTPKSVPLRFNMSGKWNDPARRRTTLNRASVDAQAKALMERAGAKGNRTELFNRLLDFYEYIAAGSELSWETIQDAAVPVVDWLTEHHASANAIDEYARGALKEIRKTAALS